MYTPRSGRRESACAHGILLAAVLVAGLALSGSSLGQESRTTDNPPTSSSTAEASRFWCDSTDPAKLDLVVTRRGGRAFLTNVAKYSPADKNLFYYVNWDLQGSQQAGQPIRDVEVEPNSLYLVHLYELDKPKTLADFWDDAPGKQASSALVWVGGSATLPESEPAAASPGKLVEVRESPRWFYYKKGDRLPFFSQRFPEFRLPEGKVLSLNLFRADDTLDGYRRHGVTHFPGGGDGRDKLPSSQRLLTMNGLFNQGIGEKPSSDPHVSPTEKAFIDSPPSHAVSKAGIVKDFDYFFLDEEFWHNDYHPATIERLCLFAREARRINPALKLADFWNPPPYSFRFVGGDEPWSADSKRRDALAHYDGLDAAMKAANPALFKKVSIDGKPTCLAEELTAVSHCVYFDNLFGHIGQYQTFTIDLFLPTAIHNARLNKRLPCNQGKPLVWFGMDILEGNYKHPRIAYPTRTTNPPGTAIFKDRLLVSPNYNEALAVFGLLEGDGIYLWDAHGVSDGDPNGIFSTMKYCIDYKDDRGEWRPDVAGTPIGNNQRWYPTCLAFAPDYYALGAWKYAQIADVVTRGKRVDFEYSMDGGKTWYVPPANGGMLADVIHDKRPVVTGAVHGQDVAVVVFHPFQGVAETTKLQIRYGKETFSIELFGTRARVYRGKLADGGIAETSLRTGE
jgi:hypothetical protein